MSFSWMPRSMDEARLPMQDRAYFMHGTRKRELYAVSAFHTIRGFNTLTASYHCLYPRIPKPVRHRKKYLHVCTQCGEPIRAGQFNQRLEHNKIDLCQNHLREHNHKRTLAMRKGKV